MPESKPPHRTTTGWPRPLTLLKAGDVVGRYNVEQRIGVGGMAEVWLVVHQQLGTHHALKVLLHSTPALQQRLMAEGMAQSRLKHKNVLPVRDILDLNGTPALLMPWIEGPSLSELCARYRPSQPEAMALFVQVVRGMSHAHANGFVHRDLKPGNILLQVSSGCVVPRVADFGLVKLRQGSMQTMAGQAMGTPAYAAPEQLTDAASVTESADIFSLGVIMVELLTGQRPFAGRNLAAICDAHERPPELAALSEPMHQLAMRLLAVKPENRIGDCETLLDLLGPIDDNALSGTALLAAVSVDERQVQAIDATTYAPRKARLGRAQLPKERDGFIGRDRLLHTIADHFADPLSRLVTLTGVGGTGKTRSALEYCRQNTKQWPGGTFWVDLAGAQDLDGLWAAVAGALGINLSNEPMEQLAFAIEGHGRCLLLMDTFEHLIPHAAATLGALLNRSTEAAFLVTSRAPLRLGGEQRLPVAPLERASAVALFAARAVEVNPEFVLDDQNRQAVASLVDALDGLPLALELAAARSRTHTPERLVQRMAQRFHLLSSDAPERPDRHRSLRAALAWSWELLTPAERTTLAQLTVFQGGFTLEAAEAVVDTSEIEDVVWVEDLVSALLDHSLLTRVQDGRDTRFSMLASVRAFAADRLDHRSGPELRHGLYYASLATWGRPDDATEALWRRERDNLHTAARRAIVRSQPEVAVPCTVAAAEIYHHFGPNGTGLSLAEDACEIPGLDPTEHGELVFWQGMLCSRMGRNQQTADRVQAALDKLPPPRATHEWRVQGMLRFVLGGAIHRLGDPTRGGEQLRRAHSELQRGGDVIQIAHCQVHLGIALNSLGQTTEGHALLEAALQTGTIHGKPVSRVHTVALHVTALRAYYQGERARAFALQQRAHQMAVELGGPYLQAWTRGNLWLYDPQPRTPDEELTFQLTMLDTYRRLGMRSYAGFGEAKIGGLYRKSGDLDQARKHLLASVEVYRPLGDHRGLSIAWRRLAKLDLSLGHLKTALDFASKSVKDSRDYADKRGYALSVQGDVQVAAGLDDAALLSYAQAVDALRASDRRVWMAWALAGQAVLLAKRGEPVQSHRLLTEAQQIVDAFPDENELAKRVAQAHSEISST